MTGIDISQQALQYARENTEGFDVVFHELDARNINELPSVYDFALEWGLLHHLPCQDWNKYLGKLSHVLNDDALYVSMTFNIRSPEFDGKGERERTSLRGTTLYYSSLQDCKELFSEYFDIEEATTITIPAGDGPEHVGNFCVLRKCE